MTTSTAEVVGGRYEIVRTLGQGAFGHTFLARDRQQDRTVAIKVLDTRGRPDHKAYELFRREAEVLGTVRHHGIPEVFDTFQDMWYGTPAAFLVMEFIDGTSLAQTIDEKRTLDGSEVVNVFLELLGVLDYLHSRVPPILHRDIKPSNIILRPNGFPALVDFGSVRRVFMTSEETGSTVAGTYGYMPYEQYMGQATPASDLFATAATFLHLLTGRPPRDFMNDEGRIRVPETLPGEPRLRGVIERLLRPSPAERFATARDVRNALVGPTAVVTGAKAALQRVPREVELVHSLPPAPRKLQGESKRLMKQATPGAIRLMYATEKTSASEDWGIFDLLTLTFFFTITAGILPIVYIGLANSRKRRMRRFFKLGVPGIGEVIKTELADLPFGEKIARVTYQFEADGDLRRDSDTVLPVIADRWQPGDRIAVLYLPDRNYDSVIVAVE
jgi:serine/threonine protein kinase